MMPEYETLKRLVAEAEEDVAKAIGGNKAAGTRVRKKMQEIKSAAQEVRKKILEGRDGFLHGYSRNPIAERLTANMGESFEILLTAVKPHACCRYMQGPIDAILATMSETTTSEPGPKLLEAATLPQKQIA